MAPKRKRAWKWDESTKDARRTRSKTKNEKNAEANAEARIEGSIQSKFKRERASIPPPIAMGKEVESSPLVKAMENGFLDDLKMFHFKDHKFLISTLLNHSNVYVSYIMHGLQGYFDSLEDDALERGRVKRILAYLKVILLLLMFSFFITLYFWICSMQSHCFTYLPRRVWIFVLGFELLHFHSKDFIFFLNMEFCR